MSVPRPPTRPLLRLLALACSIGACGSGLALANASGPELRAAHGCYLVGAPVRLHGSGFAPSRTYVLTIDGVYFGQARTDATGSFAPKAIRPGGLRANVAQTVEHVQASDGTSTAGTKFTLTRAAGARFGQTSGSGNAVKAPLEVWGFSRTGARLTVYLHYLAPSGSVKRTLSVGHTSGHCGYLKTAPRRIFPFTASPGTWTFQLDTAASYSRHPTGPVHRIVVTVH